MTDKPTGILTVLLATACIAVANAAAPYLGRPVVEVIDEVRGDGYEIAYSSRLVSQDMLVTIEPRATASLGALLEILEAHNLTMQGDTGVFLIIQKQTPAATTPSTRARTTPDNGRMIETITVSASRYQISRDSASTGFQIDQRSLQNMPDVGEDPVRMVQRLPGAAASGASARTHLRGGEESEVGIILNGQRLFDPFHVRDYQSIFSSIDSRAIEDIEVYTGGFPVRYGDRMSGVVLMESLIPDEQQQREIGISVFNTSVLLSGKADDRQWLFSARRGNLDLVIADELGRPSYYDVFSQFELDVAAHSRLSVNALYADDNVVVVLESDPEEQEQVESSTRNFQAWVQLETEWSDRLSSRTALSYTQYGNLRVGAAGDPEKLVAQVYDDRDVQQTGLRQDWSFRPSKTHFTQWGFNFSQGDARFDYQGEAEYFGLLAMFEGVPDAISRSLAATPSGASYALYFADRWSVSPNSVLEWGLRWDDQTYTSLSSDSQLSPRLSYLYRLGDATDFRISWGRYHQSQNIQELQIEDGVTNYWPAQRADHFILGIQHSFTNRISMRVEAFQKEMSDIRPRFENLYDPLAGIPELLPDRVRIEPESARSTGIELSAEADYGAWSWWGTYALSKITDRIDGSDVPRSWDQRHAIQVGVAWQGERWNINFAAGVHNGWPTTDLALVQDGVDDDDEPVYVAVPGPRNAEHLSTFFSLDFRISRKFDVRYGSLTAFVEVVNATNRKNVCCADWDLVEDEPGVLETSYDYWLPLL
ncbi:MAG TPA: TonB-dependent receptor, partial [Woeseiaceae bacterium]|nr:TonB-dependent receptor [Woeseiaceae bacterium]